MHNTQYLSNELQEFEALLEDNEQNDYQFPKAKSAQIKSNTNIDDFSSEIKTFGLSNNKAFQKRSSDAKTLMIQTEEYFKNNFLEIGQSPNGQNTTTDKPFMQKGRNRVHFLSSTKSERPKTNFSDLTLTQVKSSKSSKGAFLDPFSELQTSLRNSNRSLQKTSYYEFLSLFKHSTSHNPTKVFDETSTTFLAEESDLNKDEKKEDAEQKTPFDRFRNGFMFLKHDNSSPTNAMGKEENIIKDARKTIEQLVRAVQINPVNNYIQSLKYESQKMEQNNWREVILREHPAKIEIVIIDIINFGILKKTEINMKSIFSQDIGGSINDILTEITGMENEAKHILVYFHEKRGIRKVFLSKFFFVVKNNHSFINGLKTEKEIILYYFLTLGIFQFRLKYEDKPISEDKVNGVKAKALNIVKGLDQSTSPHLSQWLCSTIRPEVYVEKFYINQNIKGRTDVNFMFNFPDYLKSINSKFYTGNHQKVTGFPHNNFGITQSSKQETNSSKSLSQFPKSQYGKRDKSVPVFVIQASSPRVFLDPLQFDNLRANNKFSTPRTSNDIKKIQRQKNDDIHPPTPQRNSLRSLTYVSSTDQVLLSPLTKTLNYKLPNLPTESEFTKINICKPVMGSTRMKRNPFQSLSKTSGKGQ